MNTLARVHLSRPTRFSKICADKPTILVGKADSPPASKGDSDNSGARRIIITATIRDDSTVSGKLGNLKELLQKAAICADPPHVRSKHSARTYIVKYSKPAQGTQVPFANFLRRPIFQPGPV